MSDVMWETPDLSLKMLTVVYSTYSVTGLISKLIPWPSILLPLPILPSLFLSSLPLVSTLCVSI